MSDLDQKINKNGEERRRKLYRILFIIALIIIFLAVSIHPFDFDLYTTRIPMIYIVTSLLIIGILIFIVGLFIMWNLGKKCGNLIYYFIPSIFLIIFYGILKLMTLSFGMFFEQGYAGRGPYICDILVEISSWFSIRFNLFPLGDYGKGFFDPLINLVDIAVWGAIGLALGLIIAPIIKIIQLIKKKWGRILTIDK